jgi:transcriptional regulator with XRE-family HTH domain
MEDQRIGAALRRLRIGRKLRQSDLALLAGVPRVVVMAVEAGELDRVQFGHIRRMAQALGGRFEGHLLWRGADLDRLLNRGHGLMHEAVVRWFTGLQSWLALPEVSFAVYGERGVIDILAWHEASRSLLVIELKTRLVDINGLMATMDIRRRIAWQLARERGWDPVTVGIWVVVAPGRTNARILADHRAVLRAKFPADGRSMRRWLAHPQGEIAALSFLPQVRVPDLRRDVTSPRRVHKRHASATEPEISRRGRAGPRVGVTFRE